jgi:hypothetical protein
VAAFFQGHDDCGESSTGDEIDDEAWDLHGTPGVGIGECASVRSSVATSRISSKQGEAFSYPMPTAG